LRIVQEGLKVGTGARGEHRDPSIHLAARYSATRAHVKPRTISPVPEASESQAQARRGRCATHPTAPRIGTCQVCGRPLCLTCATPVRGGLVGPECLATVLDETPPPVPRDRAFRQGVGGPLAIIGFGLVALLSLLPWSHGRSSGSSGYFAAWTPHWSLLAAAAGVTGLALAILVWRRPWDPRFEVPVLAGLALVVGLASELHHRHPPLLSVSSWAPVLAIGAAGIAFVGVVLKGWSEVRARRVRLD
jgi:hypothetical protein